MQEDQVQTQEQEQIHGLKKLKGIVFFAYGFQEFALGFLTTMGVQFMAFFLTDVALIPAATAATILLIGRIVDSVDLPILGIIVERFSFRWGKYRSWLFICAPLIVIFNLLMFSNFENVSMGVKVAYLSLAYILAYICVNICSSARMALLPTFTDNGAERAKLSARRGQGVALTNVIRGAITVPLIYWIGGGTSSANQAIGYRWVVLFYGVIVIFGLYWISFLAKGHDKPVPKAERKIRKPNQATVKDMLKALVTNPPLLIFLVSNILMQVAQYTLLSFNLYYFTYVIKNMALYSLYMPIIYGGMFLGGFVTTWLMERLDNNKKLVYSIGMVINAVAALAVLFTSGAWAFIILITVAQFGYGISTGLIPAFFSDAADYGELKTGKSVKAAVMSLVIEPIKLGLLIGGGIATFGLAKLGYVAGTTDPGVINGIKSLTTIPQAIACVLCILVVIAYPLTKKRMDSIQSQLKAKAGSAT